MAMKWLPDALKETMVMAIRTMKETPIWIDFMPNPAVFERGSGLDWLIN